MTTYYVDFLNGSDGAGVTGTSESPFRTPKRALGAVGGGDTVYLRGDREDPATWFNEPLVINKAGTAWVADEGHTPTFHGGYAPTAGDRKSYAMHGRPGASTGELLGIAAADVTVSGLRVQHSGGEGIGVGANAHQARILNCEVYMTFGNGIFVGGVPRGAKVRGVEIGYCEISYISQGWFATGNKGSGCGVMLRDCEDARMHHCRLHHVCKEGVNIDRGGLGTIVEHCVIHTVNHVAVYILRTQDSHVRYNLIYHTKERDYLGEAYGKRSAPTAIRIGDESNRNDDGSSMTGHWNSREQRVYGNVVIGGGKCLHVANNSTQYETQLNGAYIGGNTFIGEVWTDPKGVSKTEQVVQIGANVLGPGPHVDSLIENNIFYAPEGVSLGMVAGVAGVTFRNNAWFGEGGGSMRPTGAEGVGDVLVDPLLESPESGSFDVEDYRPGAGSPLAGAASDGSAVGGVTPWMTGRTIGALGAVVVEPPDEPEPPKPPNPDYGPILAALEGNLARLEEAGMSVGAAVVETHELIERLREMALAGDAG